MKRTQLLTRLLITLARIESRLLLYLASTSLSRVSELTVLMDPVASTASVALLENCLSVAVSSFWSRRIRR